MLQLKQIRKEYKTGDTVVTALKGVGLTFRKSEFVSILGPSGCGKTTLLNIVGGLDQYTSGDLTIDGKSTKKFKNREWDAYRNHSVGFVFQSYNLIPHQTVLANVELALTLSGVSKSERKKRATEALEKVGLSDQLNKRPNQMSGGQMQRVAIARALVNNPEILLADEPTGALDTKTSVQIMELLKEIAKDRLIIMVTHNPDLAEEYSSRTIKLLDGEVIDDSNPYEYDEKDEENEKLNVGKTSMSFFTALSLSMNNLMTKKGRTLLISFAGSIGIIGIALILSLSNGIQTYIDRVQEDTLSSYPIMIESEALDVGTLMEAMMGNNEQEEHDSDKVYSNDIMAEMMNTMAEEVKSNNLPLFKKYIDDESNGVKELTNDIQYGYRIPLNIFASDTSDSVTQINPSTLLSDIMKASGMKADAMSMANVNIWSEMLDNPNLLDAQYDVLAGNWPKAYNEVVFVVDENNEVNDMLLYCLGLKDKDELMDMMKKVQAGEPTEVENESFSYEDILETKYKMILPTDYYQYDKKTKVWADKTEDEAYMKKVVDAGTEIKIVGIIRPNEEATATSVSGVIGYTKELTEKLLTQTNDTEMVKQQIENEDVDIFTGIDFIVDKDEPITMDDINAHIATLPEEEQAQMQQVMSMMSEEEIVASFGVALKKETTDATYEGNLTLLGVAHIDKPSWIYIYPKDFDSKDAVTDIISAYNKEKSEEGKEEDVISYTDYIGLMMSSVSTVISAISYVLIAFVGISLVVSSIMIGIITYISVLERTKEIGILRSIGASRKDISRVFNAETLIIGFSAGALGIIVTLLLNIPINIIIEKITEIPNVALLPTAGGVTLVVISMFLTFIAGLFPSKVAANKDPVEALRSE